MSYLLESAFCLAVFYAFYRAFLHRDTFFQRNRIYLLVAPLAALVLPALHVPLVKKTPAPAPVEMPVQAPVSGVNDVWYTFVENASAAPQAVDRMWEEPLFSITLGTAAWWLYLAVAGLMLLRLVVQLGRMLVFLRRHRNVSGGLVRGSGPGNAPVASFFGYVFLDPAVATSETQRLMLEHERVHVRQGHSFDILYLEVLIALQWFNPLLYLYRRSLREVHEYIADAAVVRQTGEPYAYGKLLVEQVRQGAMVVQPVLVNTFHSALKKRLLMLAQKPSLPIHRAKMALVLPLFILLMALFSFRLVEDIPAARQLLDHAETVGQELSEVIIASENTAGPMPYALYWGALQVRLEYNETTGIYTGTATASPALLREAVAREPRLWNGKSLEPTLRLRFDGIEVSSDYNNEDVYLAIKPQLTGYLASRTETDVVTLTLDLPGNQKGEVRIALDAETPEWLKSKDGAQVDWRNNPLGLWSESGPKVKSVRWGGRETSNKPALTEKVFWELMQEPPVVEFTDGRRETCLERLALVFIDADGTTHSLVPEDEGTLEWQGLQAKLESLRQYVKPGAAIGIYHWLSEAEREANDGLRSRMLLGVTIFDDFNPLLFLNRNDRSDYRLVWGDYSLSMPNMYGTAFSDHRSSENIVYADAPSTGHPWYMTKKAFERLLNETPQLYHEDSLLPNVSLQLVHNGRSYSYSPRHPDLPKSTSFERLAAAVKTGDVIRLEGISSWHRPYRYIVFPRNVLEKMDQETIITYEYSSIDVAPNRGPVRMALSKSDFERMQQRLAGEPGVWFQYGDVMLGRATIDIILRDDPPKAPLKTALPEATEGIKLSVSPNPVRENAVLTLVSPTTGTGYLNIANAVGQVVYRQKVTYDRAGEPVTFVVQRSDLTAPGVYVATVDLGSKAATCRLVVE